LTHEAYIIAEIGSNCFKFNDGMRNFECAVRQIEGAKASGADAVKFQLFTSKELWGPACHDQDFATAQDQFAMPEHWLPELASICLGHDIDFLCSAFSVDGFKKVEPYVRFHKIASPEVLDKTIVRYVARNPKPAIYSLGCKSYTHNYDFRTQLSQVDLILECVSDYPADPCHYDLISVREMAMSVGCRWGISDHTAVNWLARYARSIGASVFEKHVDFYPVGRDTPDAVVSVAGEEFRRYVGTIRDQDVVGHKALKLAPAAKYGRRMTPHGWYRPWPD
jgi:sialic acid synthase SpsE